MRGGDGLFEVRPVEKQQLRGGPAAVNKRFRAFDPYQVLLLPPSLDDWLPEGHQARFVADLVDHVLDLGSVRADYTEKRGHPPYDPRLMVRLLIYGYTTGVRSSRAIERKCADDIAFRFLAASQEPDFRSISRFRRRHLDALADLFTQSLHLAQKLGMVKMGRVALDGTELEANASKHKAMSYGRLIDKEGRVEAEIAQLEAMAAALLADAEANDTIEDQVFGVDGKDMDLPAELDRREKRLAKMQAARAQIEAEAAEKARAHAEEKERRRQEGAHCQRRASRRRRGRQGRREGPAQAEGAGQLHRLRLADHEERRRGLYPGLQGPGRRGRGTSGHHRSRRDDQRLGCAELHRDARPVRAEHRRPPQAGPGRRRVLLRVEAARDRQLACGTNTFMATGRLSHDEQVPPAPRGRIPAGATLKERMARKLRTKPGKAAYRRRKAIVEPVFGQIMTCQNGRQLLLRSEDGARGEWRLLAACHNLRKIFRHTGTVRLTAAIG